MPKFESISYLKYSLFLNNLKLTSHCSFYKRLQILINHIDLNFKIMRILKRMLILAFSVLALTFVFSSCDEEDEIEISGDSGLIVQNDTKVDAEIYFDDDFIGEVDDGESREWSVPSGTHTVKADCSYLGEIKKTPYFSSGNKIKITLYVNSSLDDSYYIQILEELMD